MRNPASLVRRCTAQLSTGEFCDARSLIDTPFPICDRHGRQIAHYFSDVETEIEALRRAISDEATERAAAHAATAAERAERRRQRMADQSVVYYVRIGDHVKIGFTNNLKHRLNALRVDPDALLATEPGGRELESERHRQFAPERVGRRENFNPSRRLLAHIEEVKEIHGDPVITTWRSGDAEGASR